MSYERFYSYPNRTLCDVLRAMRECYESRNFAHLLGLVQEAQVMADRMEAALEDQKDIKTISEKKSKLKKELKELEKEYYEQKEKETD